MSFLEKWLEAVDKKDSVLCAGLDPAEFKMGRGEKGLSKEMSDGAKKFWWSQTYVQAIAQDCVAIKPNIQYWKREGNVIEGKIGDLEALTRIVYIAHGSGLVAIEDSKLPDIGSTNDAGFFYGAEKGFDAVTYSPFAGNMAEAKKQAHDRGVGIITMCLMSNPEYEREKNKLVPVKKEDYEEDDIVIVDGQHYVKQYIQLAHDAQLYGLDGIVVGAPSKKNHITEEEIATVRRYVDDDMIVLLPGVGAQGGEADLIWKYFAGDRVIVNVGRGLMFPENKDWAETAKKYRDMLNDLRKK